MNKIKSCLHILLQRITVRLTGTGISRYCRLLCLYKYFLKLLSPESVKIGDLTIFLDKGDSLGLSIFGICDETLTNFIYHKVKKGHTVVDVGAHIGYYTLIFSKLVGKDGSVFSFEPSKENFNILKKNVEFNKLKNVVIENIAVSNKVGRTGFVLSDDSQTSKMVGSKKDVFDYYVRTVSLDEYFGSCVRNIDLVKIDVEGAECEALKGMKNILNKNKEIKLIIEFCPCHLKDFDCTSEEFLGLLADYNFALYDISHKGKVIRKSVERLLEEYSSDKNNKITNLFCIK